MARQNRGWKDGGLDIEDMALVGFIKLMKYLRVVLLQDMAVLQVAYPRCPLFLHSPFFGLEWEAFVALVQNRRTSHNGDNGDNGDNNIATTASLELLRIQPEIAVLLSGLLNSFNSYTNE